jgi:hypothetical protein
MKVKSRRSPELQQKEPHFRGQVRYRARLRVAK